MASAFPSLRLPPRNDRLLPMGTRRIATRVSQLNGEGALAVFSRAKELEKQGHSIIHLELGEPDFHPAPPVVDAMRSADRKSTRLNSSHSQISYAVFCLKKKKTDK